jgi:hypothetical protein
MLLAKLSSARSHDAGGRQPGTAQIGNVAGANGRTQISPMAELRSQS